MASYDSVSPDFTALYEDLSGLSTSYSGDKITDFSDFVYMQIGTKGNFTANKKARSGVDFEGHAGDVILDKIYFTPLSIAAGLITTTLNYNIDMWNAFTEDKTISDISIVSESGISLTSGGTPQDITAGNEKTHALQVLEEGPASQNTTITYVIDGNSFILTITGLRVLVFAFEPSQSPITLKYVFVTKIFENYAFTEQRFPLRDKPLRVLEATFQETGDDARFFYNEILEKSEKVSGFPVYIEDIPISSDPNGKSSINFADIQNMWNWQNLTDLAVIMSDDQDPEIKTISSVTSSSVVFSSAVEGDYSNSKDIVLFPLLLGIIENIDVDILHSDLIEVKLTIREIKDAG